MRATRHHRIKVKRPDFVQKRTRSVEVARYQQKQPLTLATLLDRPFLFALVAFFGSTILIALALLIII